jgi:hypothetical protein
MQEWPRIGRPGLLRPLEMRQRLGMPPLALQRDALGEFVDRLSLQCCSRGHCHPRPIEKAPLFRKKEGLPVLLVALTPTAGGGASK